MSIDLSNPPKILYLSFNQDYSCLNCGTEQGFIIYNTNPAKVRYHRNFGGGLGIVEVLKTSNILILVGGGDHPKYPVNKLVIWDDYQEKVITDVQTNYKILGVKFNEKCLAIVCKNVVKLYKLESLKFLNKIETHDNPDGICTLSSVQSNPILIVPGIEPGSVTILNHATGVKKTVSCHQNPINSITLNANSTKFATTSETGTLVRIFDLETNSKINELRRGSDSCQIYSVEFSGDSTSLVTTSSKNTIHVFSLLKDIKNNRSKLRSVGGMVSGYFKSEWSLFEVEWEPVSIAPNENEKADTSNLKKQHIATILENPDTPGLYTLFVVGYDGKFASYNFKLASPNTQLPSNADGADELKKDHFEKLSSGNLFQLFKEIE